MPTFDKGKKITPLFIDAQVKKKGAGRYSLGENLYLNVRETGKRAYVFRYMFNDKIYEMGLGSGKVTSLAEARDIVVDYRRMLRDGKNPKIEKRKALAAQTPVDTFKDHAQKYFETHENRWTSEQGVNQWQQTMREYAYPIIGHLLVNEIDRTDIIKVLKQPTVRRGDNAEGPLWELKNETARRLRLRIEKVLESAEEQQMRKGDNPAAYDKMKRTLPPVTNHVIRHHPALPYKELPAFMVKLRELDSMSARCSEFCILTAVRGKEARGARREEIDFVNKIWTIPAKRMKAGKEHRVPLSPQALACIPDHNRDVIFTGHSAAELSNMALPMCLKGIAEKEKIFVEDDHGELCLPTVHGFRSCFRDWAAEQTGFPAEACEIALAHNPKGAVEAAYNRTDYLGMRRALMNHWAEYADGLVPYVDPHADDGTAAYELLKRPAPAHS